MHTDLTRNAMDCFSDAASTYDSFAQFQYFSAKKLANYIKQNIKDTSQLCFLDLGCGTGLLSQILHAYFPKSRFVLVDLSEKMLHQAYQKFQTQALFSYIQADGQDFQAIRCIITQNQCNILVSNVCFQWFQNPDLVFAHYKEILPCFVSSLLEGSFQSWYASLEMVLESFEKPIHFMSSAFASCRFEYEVGYHNTLNFLRAQKSLGTLILSEKNALSVSQLRSAMRIFQEIYHARIGYQVGIFSS